MKHLIKTKTKAETKIETILMVMAFVCEPQEERWKVFFSQVSTYYDTRGSYFGFDKECDGNGFETGICPNDL